MYVSLCAQMHHLLGVMRYPSKGEWASNPYPGSVCMCAYLGCPQHGHMQVPSLTLLYLH